MAAIVDLIGHSMGGGPAAHLISKLGKPVSDDTILRQIKRGASISNHNANTRDVGIDGAGVVRHGTARSRSISSVEPLLTPRQQGRRHGSRLGEYADFITGMMEVCPDITLNEMVARLEAEQSARIGRSTLSGWLRGHSGTFKKVRTCTGAGASRTS